MNHDQVRSVTHRSTRVFEIQPDGAIENRLLMPKIPQTQEEADAIRELVRQNPPVIFGRFVSYDEKAALITANFVTDRLSGAEVYQAVFEHVERIKLVEEDANHKIYLSGAPVLVGWILRHAFEIGAFLLATIAMIFGLLWAYFRRWHGVFIPFVAAVATVIWGLGYCGWRDITFDPLILVIPMIITARAVSHTVQMAERFFEDYEIMLPRYGDPEVAKREVATIAMGELIVPGTLGIITDVCGPARDPRDDDPADARSRRVRRLLGGVDRDHGRDPAPDPDLLHAGANRVTSTSCRASWCASRASSATSRRIRPGST